MTPDLWTEGFEGNRLMPYWDKTGAVAKIGDTPAGTLTVGKGHTGHDVCIGVPWNRAQVDYIFDIDLGKATAVIIDLLGEKTVDELPDARYGALRDMAFNMGPIRLSKFTNMLAAAQRGDWTVASNECLSSDYAKELPKRAVANASLLATSQWPGVHPNDSSIS